MPVLPILPKTDDSLQPSIKVTNFKDPEVLKCIAALTDTMAAEQARLDRLYPGAGGGVGLAANQLGFTFDIYIVSVREVRALSEKCETVAPTIYINSTFEPLADSETGAVKRSFLKEACLSVAGFQGQNVPRYDNIKITAQNTAGEEITFNTSGFIARIHQHEIDHSLGQEYLDHLHFDDNELEDAMEWITVAKRGAPVDLTVVSKKLNVMPFNNNRLIPKFTPDVTSLEVWVRYKKLRQDQLTVLTLHRAPTSLSFYHSPDALSPASSSSSTNTFNSREREVSASSPPLEKLINTFPEDELELNIKLRKM